MEFGERRADVPPRNEVGVRGGGVDTIAYDDVIELGDLDPADVAQIKSAVANKILSSAEVRALAKELRAGRIRRGADPWSYWAAALLIALGVYLGLGIGGGPLVLTIIAYGLLVALALKTGSVMGKTL